MKADGSAESLMESQLQKSHRTPTRLNLEGRTSLAAVNYLGQELYSTDVHFSRERLREQNRPAVNYLRQELAVLE